jgi:DNA-binding protein H-NS
MELDLSTLSMKELKDLQSQVTRAIATFEDRKRKQALGELEEKAKSLGFSLAELTGVTTVKKRAPAVAKYANPANRAETWSGRGRKPRWFEAALNAGKSPEDLAI